METARRREKDSCLTCTQRWAASAGEGRLLRQGREGEGGAEERAEAAHGKEGLGRLGHGGCFIEKT
jgi:hypothetical protein